MGDKYILKDHKPILEPDLMKWGAWFETADRIVAKTEIVNEKDEIRISTVFLGLDHSFGEGKPLLFETMVFGGKLDGEMDRYGTWEEAEQGHKNMVEKVRNA